MCAAALAEQIREQLVEIDPRLETEVALDQVARSLLLYKSASEVL